MIEKRGKVLVFLGLAGLLFILLAVAFFGAGRSSEGYTVVLGDCDPTVSNPRVKCGQGSVRGYFLFPREIVGMRKAYDPDTGTITVVTEETKPIGCYRPFEVNWQGIDVRKVLFIIEIDGKQAGRTALDVNACAFYRG